MSQELKLYVLAYTTMLDASKIESIKKELPSRQQIYEHIIAQQHVQKSEFKLIEIEIPTERYKKIINDIRSKSCIQVNDQLVLISAGDNKHPLISLSEKKEEIVENK